MRTRRTFTKDFKREVVEAVASGQVRQLEMSRKYGISPVVISRWKKEYLEGKFFENNDPDTTRLEIKLRELERLIGELTVENRTLKKIWIFLFFSHMKPSFLNINIKIKIRDILSF